MSRLTPILTGLTDDERVRLASQRPGLQFELAVTGRCARYRRRGAGRRMGFWKALDFARANCPENWNPLNPHRTEVRRLRWLVARHFPAEEQRQLTVFSTVGTPLDFHHGADLVICWGPIAVVTIDLSLKDKPVEARLADILIQPEDFRKEDGQDRRLRGIAKDIVRLLRRKNRINVIGR